MDQFMKHPNFPFNGTMPYSYAPQPAPVGVPTWVINGTTYYNMPPPSAFAKNQTVGPGTTTTSGTYQHPNGGYSTYTSTQNRQNRNYHSAFPFDRRTNGPAPSSSRGQTTASSSNGNTTTNNPNCNNSYSSVPPYPNSYVNTGINTTTSTTVNNFGGSHGRQYPHHTQLPWPLLQVQPQFQSLLQNLPRFQEQQPLPQVQPSERPQDGFQTSGNHEQHGQNFYYQHQAPPPPPPRKAPVPPPPQAPVPPPSHQAPVPPPSQPQAEQTRPQTTSHAPPPLQKDNTPAPNGPLREDPQSFLQGQRRASPVHTMSPMEYYEAGKLELQWALAQGEQRRAKREEHARLQREENERNLGKEQERLAREKQLAKDWKKRKMERTRAMLAGIRQGLENREREKEEQQKELERVETEKARKEEERLAHEVRVEKERKERGRSKETKGNGTAADPFVLDDSDSDEIAPAQAVAQTQRLVKTEHAGEMVRELTMSISLVSTLGFYTDIPKVSPPPKAPHSKTGSRTPSATSARTGATTPASAVSSESSYVLAPTPTPAPRAQAARRSSATQEPSAAHKASPYSPSTIRSSSGKRKRDEEGNLNEPGETVEKRPKESGEFVQGRGERAKESSEGSDGSKRKRDVGEEEEEQEGVMVVFKKRSRPY